MLKKNLFLVLFLLLSGRLFGAVGHAQCPEGMVAYWDFDETVPGTYSDRIGGNLGFCEDDCPRPNPLGRVDGAQQFDGTGDGIEVQAFPGLNWAAGADFAIEFDFRKSGDTLSGQEAILGRSDPETGLLWWAGLASDGAAVFFLRAPGGETAVLQGNRNLADSNWHHVVVLRDSEAGELRMYVDMEIAARTEAGMDAALVSDAASLTVGATPEAGPGPFLGLIDEFALYDRVPTEEEIGNHFFNGLADKRWGYCEAPRTIRIMPLGDSITAGVTDLVIDGEMVGIDDIAEDGDLMLGYRQTLFLTLQAIGFSVDFVGSLRMGAAGEPEFDLENEGHPGWTAGEVANSVFGWLSANPADIVLLHVGTNGLDPVRTVPDVERVLDEIDRFDPEVTVVLARIINKQIPDPNFSLYNANLSAMARNRVLKGDKIIIVDQESALDYPDDLADDLHPNASGYQKMARTWLNGLLRSPEMPVNQPPVAVAGSNQIVREGSRVFLDGGDSFDPDGGIARYRWEQVSGTPVTLENADSQRASFAAPSVSTFGLVFRLVVTDVGNLEDSDEVLVTVNAAAAPIADAGRDRSVDNGETVVLDGNGSTAPGSSIVAYRWEQISGPPVTLASPTSPVSGFAAPPVSPEGAVLGFRLTIRDALDGEASDEVEIRVNFANLPPSADAGENQVAVEGRTVTLDGSRSADSDGGIARYAWEQIGGAPVVLSDSAAVRPTFVAPPVGGTALAFRLTVEDGDGLIDVDEVRVAVNANGIEGFAEGVKTFTSIAGQPLGITVSGGALVRLTPVDPAEVPETRNRPQTFRYGLFDLVILADTPGGTADVTFYLPEPAPEGHEWFDRNPAEGWRGFGSNQSISPDRTRILVRLADGGFGDDGSNAARDRGRIDNLSGLGYVPPPVEEEKGDLIGCFIGNLSETRQRSFPWISLIPGLLGIALTTRAGWKREK
ncbi:MAG: PKD domain-containing protein [Desulfococcaceae bacterium]